MATTDITRWVRQIIKDQLKIDGRDTFEYDTDNKFLISEDFIDSTTLNVFHNGTLLATQDWSYSSTTNKVTITFITSGSSLVASDIIEITYSYYNKYSDIEIRGFIESSLLYFAKFRYEKLFTFNSSNEVKTINGINPTTTEEYIIAMITAILIDPNNVSIRTKEFSLDAQEKKTKSEQISEVFARFRSFVGEIEFIQEDLDGDN